MYPQLEPIRKPQLQGPVSQHLGNPMRSQSKPVQDEFATHAAWQLLTDKAVLNDTDPVSLESAAVDQVLQAKKWNHVQLDKIDNFWEMILKV